MLSGWLRRLLDNITERGILTALGVLIGACFAATFTLHMLSGAGTNTEKLGEWVDTTTANLMTEMCGAFVTFVLIDVALRRRLERESIAREDRERQKQLIRQLRSSDHALAMLALDELRDTKAVYDGSLKDAFLVQANWEGATFHRADLTGAFLGQVNLKGGYILECDLHLANISNANLEDTRLFNCLLRGADLTFTNLEGAIVQNCDLSSADLRHANLQGTNLEGTRLTDADLSGIELDEHTVLPDKSHWSKECDLARFTDPQHPNYYKSTSLPLKDETAAQQD